MTIRGLRMKIAIIHLSDIHFRENEKDNILHERIDKLANAIRGQTVGIKYLLLMVTGDIAFSGKPGEYAQAKDFFNELIKMISIDEEKEFKIVLIPGNHDCDFSDVQNERCETIKLIVEKQLSIKGIWDSYTQVQTNFFQFRYDLIPSPDFIDVSTPKIFEVIAFEIESKRIICNLLNTAWISQLKEKQGELFFPIEEIVTPESCDKTDDLVITLLHHPYGWFKPDNARSLRNKIDSISDIILTGHEHESEVYEKIKRNGDTTEYIEGGVLQDLSVDESAFNVLIIDFDSEKQEIYTYVWNNVKKIYEPDGEPLFYNRICNQNRPNAGRQLCKDFEKTLKDIGMKFTHPNVDDIEIDDLFVFPHLRNLLIPTNLQLSKSIIQESIPDFIRENKHVLILGAERCGKTILSRKLFNIFLETGLCPILLEGALLKNHDEGRIDNLLKRQLEAQYKKPDTNEYFQLEKCKRAIIVDDFHKGNLNAKGREKVIEYLKKCFEIIVIIGSEELRVDELFLSPEDSPATSDFIECEIMGFGHVKRAELIKKWYLLGQSEYSTEESGLSQTIVRAERIITSVLGKNYIPPYPFYILVLLQQLEVGISVSTTSGSIGYLYESLLTLSLTKMGSKGRDIDKQYSYLSEMAYNFFSKKIRKIPEGKLNNWHSQYCTKYKLTIELSNLLHILIGASILKREDDGVSFKYSYMYYYFVARFFRDHINEDVIKDYIRGLSERLHQTEAANIIIFLCYLSKDPFILNTLLSSSKRLFTTYAEFDVISDTAFVANLLSKVPKLLLNAENPDENHNMELKKKDEVEQTQKDDHDEETGLDSKSDFDLEEFFQVNVAFKSIQILGQLLKNFPGSWQGDQKFELVQQCYALGLRGIKFVFKIFEDGQEDIVQRIAEILKNEYPKWEDQQVYDGIHEVIFSLLEGYTYIFIKHIADSVGHNDFAMTYNDVLERYPDNLSYQFIDLSIHLDFYTEFPTTQVFELARTVYKNNFANFLLRHSVWYYFYIYKTKHALRQSVCDKLDIQLTNKRKRCRESSTKVPTKRY